MEKGIKHLIKCRCILPQFKNQLDSPDHQFIVFSILDDEDSIRVRFTQCNNCGVIHKITDICTSEIMPGRDHMSSVLTLEEIKTGIPEQLVALLETHYADHATWEHVKWVFDNARWGEVIILMTESVDGLKQGKFVRILGEKLFKVDTFTRDEIISYGVK